MEFFVNLPVSSIYAAITDHFVMLFRDMSDEAFYELHNRKSFLNIGVIFVAVIMEGNKVTIIFVNPGSCNYGTTQITPDVFYNRFWITFVWFGIDIEAVFVIPVTAGFDLFERGTDFGFHFIEKSSTERITEKCIVKVIDIAPEAIVTVTTLRNKAVDVRVPF